MPTPPIDNGFPDWLMGHRGARDVAPENSIAGFTWAIEHGLRSVEFDVRLTGDGVLVCAHDESLEVHGGPTGPISELAVQTLAEVVLANGQGVPRLTEVLDLTAGQLALNIEIKNDPREGSFDDSHDAATVLSALLESRRAAGAGDDIVAVSSFDRGSVAAFKAASSHFGGLAALLTAPGLNSTRILAQAMDLGVTAVHPHHTSLLPPSACRRLVDAGLVVRAWTVNNRLLAQRLLKLGVDTIVTDDPRRLAPR